MAEPSEHTWVPNCPERPWAAMAGVIFHTPPAIGSVWGPRVTKASSSSRETPCSSSQATMVCSRRAFWSKTLSKEASSAESCEMESRTTQLSPSQ